MAHYSQQQAHLHNFHGRKIGGLLQGEGIILQTDEELPVILLLPLGVEGGPLVLLVLVLQRFRPRLPAPRRFIVTIKKS